MTEVSIIGAGHNGLVAACYLAKAGYTVSIYERSERLGGLCVNEEIFPGTVVSTWANWAGMFQPEILRDLSICPPEKIQEKVINLNHDGSCVIGDAYYINNLSETDKNGAERLEEDLYRLAAALKDLFLHPKPTRSLFLEKVKKIKLNYQGSIEEFLNSSAIEIAAHYISHDALKSMLACQTFIHPGLSGTAFEMIYMRTPETGEDATGWGVYRGGMGALTKALASRAKELGVKIYLNQNVNTLTCRKNVARSIRINDSAEKEADIFIYLPQTILPIKKSGRINPLQI